MPRTLLFLGAFLLGSSLTSAQIGPTGGRDTSFTVRKSFIQEKKKQPNITLADSTLPLGVRVTRNLPYSTPTPGRSLLLDVYAPPQSRTRQHPAVLMIHGGGWRSGDRSHNNTMAGRLAEWGFVAIPVEYRLSTEALYPASVHDVKAAIRWMRANAKRYQIDPNRIAVLGFSSGGQLAALIGSTNDKPLFEGMGGHPNQSSRVQAVVDIDGILAFIHLESGEGNDTRSTSAATYWFGYSKTEKPELWNEASALHQAGLTTPPMLFLNSSVERMHAGRDDLMKKLNGFGVYTEVHTFADAPHTFLFFEPWFTPTLNYITGFLNQTLKK
ncbi:alpha/beta hydrolase fold domain-containing protein [Rudanella paleaurantiibacter]|uniref:Alpha/beta hydrolase fold domain-containing protein n=1 Tax=Rudanella paleaurantiibacter TaxID=2614655 RepID=A0A7J5TUH1_9BACT|nr:alpha/beta hydrolase [Rudanella paleaurantiibacter]KAB7727655.1 alpha/beta hydrolase fold domain-containing protein [Rudanella paleaurantiibacter]